METSCWRYYNHVAIPSTAPHENVDLRPIQTGAIWNIQGKKPLLARWTSEFDCLYETNWWYIIKDTPFDINLLKSKRRYEINKGLKNYTVRIIDPIKNIDELYEVTKKAYSSWPAKYRPSINETSFKMSIYEWNKYTVFGAFSIETNILSGYAALIDNGSYIDFVSLRVDPECEKKAINAAIVASLLDAFNSRLGANCYICDGARSMIHETAFQEYLEKYFGFRKAYCHLHIRYRFPMGIIINLLYPFRKCLHGNGKHISQLYAILQMESLIRNNG